MSRGNITLRNKTLCYKIMFYCFYIKAIRNISGINSLSLQIHQQIQNKITEILI